MADISALYPQPPAAPQPQQGLLSGDPLRLVGMLGELQKIQLLRQQMPALAQQPAANLQGTNLVNANTALANVTARLAQQADAQHRVAAGLGAMIPAGASPDDVHSATAYFARSNPDIARQFPDMIPAAADVILKHPKGIGAGRAILLNSALSPGEASGRVVGPPTASGAPTTMSVPQANLAGAGIVTGTPPGSETSAGVMQADLARAGTYSSDIFPLNRALELAKSLGPGGMGPGTEGRQKFESYVYSLMPQLVPQEAQNKIKNYAELEKYLINNTQNRAQNLGPHTNEGLATAVTGSPNVHINDLAGIDLIKAQIALRKMEQTQTMQSVKAGPVGYTTVKPQISAQLDPRAFHIENMEPAEIQRLQKTLKGPERARFNASLRAGIESGVITPPGQ